MEGGNGQSRFTVCLCVNVTTLCLLLWEHKIINHRSLIIPKPWWPTSLWDTNTRCHGCHGATLVLLAKTLSDHRGSMQAGAHALSPSPSMQCLNSPLFNTLCCIPGERVAACGSLESYDMVMMDVRGVEYQAGAGHRGSGGLQCGDGGHSPDCQTASLQPQLPRTPRLAGSQGQHGRARDCSQSTAHTLGVEQLKQAQGQDWIPPVTDWEMKHFLPRTLDKYREYGTNSDI